MKSLSKYIISSTFLVALFLIPNIQALKGQHVDWVKHYHWNLPDFSGSGLYEMEVDPNGNIVAAGVLNGAIDLDPGQGEFFLESDTLNIFVFKTDPDGNLLWSHVFNGAEGTISRLGRLKIDSDGNIIFYGVFGGILDVDPSGGIFLITSEPDVNDNTFFLKLNPDGELIFLRRFITPFDPLNLEHPWLDLEELHVDSQNNIYISGMGGNMDLDPGEGEFFTNPDEGNSIIAKYSPNGDFIWGANFGSLENEGYAEIDDLTTLSNGDLLIIGDLNGGPFDMNPDPSESFPIELNNFQESPIFVLKLTPQGDFIWCKTIGGKGEAIAAIGPTDEIVLYGYFNGAMDFDPGTGIFEIDPEDLESDFILKLDGDGNFNWVTPLYGTDSSDIWSSSLSIDQDGSIIIGGEFNQSLELISTNNSAQIESSGDYDMFIGQLISDGSVNFLKGIGGPSFDGLGNIKITDSGRMYALGYFSETVNFSFGDETNLLSAQGGIASFLMEFNDEDALSYFTAEKDGITIYPIPTSDFVNIELPSSGTVGKTDLIDLTGKVLLSAKTRSKKLQFDLREVPAGIYLLRIETDEGISQRRVVKI